jgi:hypothetical protein
VVYHGNLYLLHTTDDQVQQLTTSGNVTTVRWRW